MNDFGAMQYAASGMDAQRSALDVLAHNVQLVQTADRTHPVHPLVPQFAVADDDAADFEQTLSAAFGSPMGDDDDGSADGTSGAEGGPAASGDSTGPTLGATAFDGSAGNASASVAFASVGSTAGGDDASVDDSMSGMDLGGDDGALPGQVAFAGARPSKQAVTSIDAVSEMVAVLGAQRAFEADASTFDAGKRLIEKTVAVEQ